MKVTLSFNFKNYGIPSVLPSDDPYQQTRSGRTKNISHQNIIICFNFYFHQTPIQSKTHQRKNIKNSQEHFKFALPKMQIFLPLQHQNHMLNSLPTWILTTILTFLFLLSFSRSLKCDYLEPKLNNLWSLSTLVRLNSPMITPLRSSVNKSKFLFNDETGKINNVTGK